MKTSVLFLFSVGIIAIYLNGDHMVPSVSMENALTAQELHSFCSPYVRIHALRIPAHLRYSPPSSPKPDSPVTYATGMNYGSYSRYSPPSSPKPGSPVTYAIGMNDDVLSHVKPSVHMKAIQKVQQLGSSYAHLRNSPPSSPKPDSPVTYKTEAIDCISVIEMAIVILFSREINHFNIMLLLVSMMDTIQNYR
uniref:Secreted protein n=1 Tax=Caenorhabditis tropicalis TaxID=1561998 RepID=A0A1I7USE2_9PELO